MITALAAKAASKAIYEKSLNVTFPNDNYRDDRDDCEGDECRKRRAAREFRCRFAEDADVAYTYLLCLCDVAAVCGAVIIFYTIFARKSSLD